MPQPTKPTVSITTNTEEIYILPYGHFLVAHLVSGRKSKTEDRLILTFATHTVLIQGHGLHFLLEKLEFFDLRKIAPGNLSFGTGAEIPVTKVEVAPNSEE